jgi:GNAT superfamily N-acetyltransferase
MKLVELGREAMPDVRDVLCDAFAEYPVMRYVLGGRGNYRERLTVLVGLFVANRMLADDLTLGVLDGSELAGVATIALPDTVPPAELEALREEAWDRLGVDARARYDTFRAAIGGFTVDGPSLFLDMLGARAKYRGHGVGRLLLDGVHDCSRRHPTSQGVALTTENLANVDLYRHFGYRLLGHERVTADLETWGLFREDGGRRR